MRNEPSREAVNLALELFDNAQRRSRRGENDPTHAIAVVLQRFMDERDLFKNQIAVTMGDHELRER